MVACEAVIEACQERFLPGFWLPDCDDFEAWLDHIRQSLLRQQVSLLETLAEQRVIDGHLELGIHHARHLTHLMPYDDGTRRRLMRNALLRHRWSLNILRRFKPGEFGLTQTGPELIEQLIAGLAEVGCNMHAAELS